MEHGDRGPAQIPKQVGPPPVGAVQLLVEVFVEIGSRFLQPVNPVPEGKVAVPLIGQRLGEVAGGQHVFVHLGQQVLTSNPLQSVASLEYGVGDHPSPFHGAPGVVDPALVEVGRRRHWGHGLEVRGQGIGPGQRVLGGAQVGLASGANPSGGPGLAGGPLHGIPSVMCFLEDRVVVVSFGIESGAAVLADEDIAILREEPHGVVGLVQVAFLAVGAAVHQDRKASGGVGPEDVGGQPGPVPHRHHDVAFSDDLVFPSACHEFTVPSQFSVGIGGLP